MGDPLLSCIPYHTRPYALAPNNVSNGASITPTSIKNSVLPHILNEMHALIIVDRIISFYEYRLEDWLKNL